MSIILIVEADRPRRRSCATSSPPTTTTPAVGARSRRSRARRRRSSRAVVLLGDLAERRARARAARRDPRRARPFDPRLPALVLSAPRHELDVLRAFHHGADDVVAKPAGYPELRARIAALLRRRRRASRASSSASATSRSTPARAWCCSPASPSS